MSSPFSGQPADRRGIMPAMALPGEYGDLIRPLTWPVIHAITGGYIGNHFGMPWVGASVGLAVGIFTAWKITSRFEYPLCDALGSLLLLALMFASPHVPPQFMVLGLTGISVLPLALYPKKKPTNDEDDTPSA